MLDGQLERKASSAPVPASDTDGTNSAFPRNAKVIAVPHGTSKMVAAFCGVRVEGAQRQLELGRWKEILHEQARKNNARGKIGELRCNTLSYPARNG
jgi:hypothetical protein